MAVDNVAHLLKAQGCHVSVVADRFQGAPKEEFIDGIAVRRVWYLMPTTLISMKPGVLLSFFAHLIFAPFVFLYTFIRLASIIRSERPNIVNVHYLGRNAFYALILRPFFPFRLVLNVCGYDVDRYHETSRIMQHYIKTMLRLSDLVLTYTQDQMWTTETICPGTSERAAVVGQGINPQEFDGVALFHHPQPYLLAISNLFYRKGIDVLLRAFALVHNQHPDLDLIIVGEGEERTRLIPLARELEIIDSVVFFGTAPRPEVGALLKGCEFLVLPSRTEAFGMVLIEAMLVGKTAVATRVGGIPEVLNGGKRGLLVDPESPISLAEGISTLLEDSELRKRLSDKLSEMVQEEYSWSIIAKRYLSAYRQALENSK